MIGTSMHHAMAHRFGRRKLQFLQGVKSRLDRSLVIGECPEIFPGKAQCLRVDRQACIGQSDPLDSAFYEGRVLPLAYPVEGELQRGGTAVEAHNDRRGCHQWPPPTCCCGTAPNALSIRA